MVGPEVHSARKSGAAPPLYLLAVILPPIGGALYISASRFFDFRHHAFDILFGSLIGILTAVFAFRWYHLPLGRGGGWAWSPRDRNSAFGAGVGTESYQTPIIQGDDYDSESLWERPSQSANTDIEMTGAVRNSQHVGPEPVAVP